MNRVLHLAFIGALAFGICGISKADDWRRDRDYGWNQGNASDAYQRGLQQGERDRARGRRYDVQSSSEYRRGDDRYRRAYRDGYDQGYNGGGYYGGNRYPNYPNSYPNYPNYPNRYPNGGYGPYGSANRGYGNNGYSQGMADGRSDGIHDLNTGHSYRPTENSNYKHADRGFNSGYGSKDAYKQAYREGYMAGYDQGYRRR